MVWQEYLDIPSQLGGGAHVLEMGLEIRNSSLVVKWQTCNLSDQKWKINNADKIVWHDFSSQVISGSEVCFEDRFSRIPRHSDTPGSAA